MLTYEQLKMFCSPHEDEPRQYIREPFKYNGRVYATDGHILVRCVGDGEYAEPYTYKDGPNKEKNLAQVINGIIAGIPANSFIKIPDWDKSVPDFEECKYCHGSMIYECGECGHEHDCEHCDKGKTRIRNPMKIGVSHIDAYFLRKIESLPNVLISLPNDPIAAVPFVFDGGEGLVMPMRV